MVCDTSTLIALSRIGRLDILEKTAERVVIPAAVYREVVIRGHGRPGAAEVRDATWIEQRHVADRSMIAQWQTTLGAGESEAIALAKEVHAELLILDDEDAREVALSEDLPVVGLLAFLLRAKEQGIVSRLQPLLADLRRHGFFMSDEVYHHILQRSGE